MAAPRIPQTLQADFEADGFTCVLHSNEALVTLPTLRWLGAAAVVTTVAGMLAVGPVSPGMALVGLLMWPWMLIALLYGGGKLLNIVLAAPRVTRLRCNHDALSLEVLVHGMLRADTRIPLSEIEACRIGGSGLEILRRVGDRLETVDVPSLNRITDLEWITDTIGRAVEVRARFDADERSHERLDARRAAERLLARRDAAAQPTRER